jgi:DNA ligase-1
MDAHTEYNEFFPKLYKKTSTGAIQEWEVFVSNSGCSPVIVTKYGQLGGKIQTSTEVITEGKNIGRSNETSPMQQACLQAKSDWEKQLKKGYVDNVDDAEEGKIDAIIKGGIAPMLAHKFSEQGHKIKYPALVQPKLDGHRCTSQRDGEITPAMNKHQITLWNRTRKPITSVPHIIKAIQENYVLASFERLDGELYNHGYHNNFEELSSLIRQEEPQPKCTEIQYHIYDIPTDKLTNEERNNILQAIKKSTKETPIHIVETIVVNDEDELMDAFDHFIAQGYEGCMVRNMDGLYVNKRSYDLQKVKEFDDDEFKIVGIKVGTKGSMAGKAVFICELPKINDTFEAKMKGSMDDLKRYADDPTLVIGKILTVQYQGYTKYGKPRFPVGLRFREDI